VRTPLHLTNQQARRLVVTSQLLSAPRSRDILDVVRHLGFVQMDPTASIARTEHLVLFARLGSRYRIAELERLLWTERSLFEYRAFILPTSDFAIYRETMRRYPSTSNSRHEYVRTYLRDNAGFRRHVLARLRHEGPLRTRDFEDRSAVGWRTGGWNDDGRNTGMMLEVLWAKGEVMIVGRDGQQRIWDLAERRLPLDEPRLARGQETRRLLDRQLRSAGPAAVPTFGLTFEGTRAVDFQKTLDAMVREGVVVPVEVEGLRGVRYAHAVALERASKGFRPRTVVLSPFDRTVYDRRRTEELFGFRYRLEIYVPPAKREYGYFVLPILSGDRLIGRLDPVYDREKAVLRINGVWAEEGARESDGPKVAAAIAELARWRGARDTTIRKVPRVWRRALGG
jgi:uncharacterized protein